MLLDKVIKVYIPSTTNVNDIAVDQQAKWTDAALTKFSELFGGATVIPATGAWVSETKGLVKESINIVYAYCSALDLRTKQDKVAFFALELCKALNQEAVSLEVDGRLYFVSKDTYNETLATMSAF